MAKDKYHYLVKEALIAEGWTITDDPYPLDEWDPDWEIDLGAERVIAAQKGKEKIAVEIKSFRELSFAYEFHRVIGQYFNYRVSLKEVEHDRVLYMAVPSKVWKENFDRKGILASLKEMNAKVIIYNTDTKKIEQWITYSQK